MRCFFVSVASNSNSNRVKNTIIQLQMNVIHLYTWLVQHNESASFLSVLEFTRNFSSILFVIFFGLCCVCSNVCICYSINVAWFVHYLSSLTHSALFTLLFIRYHLFFSIRTHSSFEREKKIRFETYRRSELYGR